MATRTRRGTARDRLIETTAAVIYRRGVTATGVDTITAAATVSKPTLYAHFRSKSELVTAALARQHGDRRDELARHLDGLADRSPAERILAIFDWLGEGQRAAGARGCAFVNAAAELVEDDDAAARQVIRDHKRWWADTFTELARQGGADDPAVVGAQLLLVLDGANARVLVEGDTAPFALARRLAELVLAAGLSR
ncbi:TetR/AcrR family transcriptional regulator [Actinocatenispora sera]|uniref:TetR family transcriptional regulator n=1 Tax=Actinocatenispora sera TaxID=390989 RepID=A0A810L604_9ACTN|nr:TetR/AcrR family transcriptional regulator [Actinocatenispora sera]BCJ30335.1 TetR family transcriptional regulator [Actinocatenispora sera]